MFDPDIPDMAAARRQLETRRLTPDELWSKATANLQRFEPVVKAFVFHDPGELPPAIPTTRPMRWMEAMPTGIKDLIDVAGMPTTGSSRAYHWVAQVDAPAVARLRAAGAHIVGKTNTQELAYGVFTPPTRNPWNLDHIPGGSSGGTAAALAAGMILAGLGTDTGGSIRIPAACCGVVGFKPSYGRVPIEGVMPLSWSLDHVGPLAHSVADAALMYQLLVHEVPLRPLPEASTRYRRAGIPWTYIAEHATKTVKANFLEAVDFFRHSGWDVVEIPMNPWSTWLEVQSDIRGPESYLAHRTVLNSPQRELLSPDLARRLDQGGLIPGWRYLAARQRQSELQYQWRQQFTELNLDVLLMPTIPTAAPRVGETVVEYGGRHRDAWETLITFTAPWNLLGFPALSVPSGFDEKGLPLALQIVALRGRDPVVLAVGHFYEQHHPWRRCLPPQPLSSALRP